MIKNYARFARGVQFSDMSDDAVAAIKRVFLDSIGCAVGASECEPARLVEEALSSSRAGQRKATDREATDIARGTLVSAEDAVLLNGIRLRYHDFMDVYWARDVCHPSENIPLALATAERVGASGVKLIEAIAVGYECQIRLCDAISVTDRGFHHVSAAGFVAPAVIGKLLDLTDVEIAHAVALGGTRHMTLSALSRGHLSMAKALGYPLTAMESLLTVAIARTGFTGPLDSLDWVVDGLPSAGDEDRVAEGDVDFERPIDAANRVSLKKYPVQYALQGPVEACAEIATRHHLSLGDIKSVTILAAPRFLERTADPSKYEPASRETADHSLPFCAAAALLDGDLTLATFEGKAWLRSDVRALMRRIHATPSEDLDKRDPNGRSSRVTIDLNDGEQISVAVTHPEGDARNPMSDAAVVQKFRSLCKDVWDSEQISHVLDHIDRLEELDDVRLLTRAMRVGMAQKRAWPS